MIALCCPVLNLSELNLTVKRSHFLVKLGIAVQLHSPLLVPPPILLAGQLLVARLLLDLWPSLALLVPLLLSLLSEPTSP